MKKSIFVVAILAFFGLGLAVTAQSTWSTSWISSGGVVSSQNLKSNLDYLYENKAHKPENCQGQDEFLGWNNGSWVCQEKDAAANCGFNGTTVSAGDSITAYQASSVAFGQSCQSQQRSCTNGVLGGTYTASVCTVTNAGTCTFNGNTVAHGTNVTAYQASSVAFGETCQSQTRSCSNGTLSGSYQAPGCVVVAATGCSFNSDILSHGDTTTAYENSNVAFGETCQSETRACNNAVLSGSFTANSCTVAPAATCVFNGNTMNNGETATAYQASSVSFGQACQSQTRSCSNGTLSGSYEEVSCSVSKQDPAVYYHRDFFDKKVIEKTCTNWGFTYACNETRYVFEGNNGLYTNKPNGYGGTGTMKDGLGANPATLAALCKLKGYKYNTSSSRLSSFKSPKNNWLIYYFHNTVFTGTTASHYNKNLGGGSITCSDSATSSGSTGGGSNGGGGNRDVFRNINLF